ncbi:MAG TPA: hypothetical protein PLA92_02850 [Fimbriimonadaceae bacterium]|nr:hypothetical protein [Fimbriimonadaceae bacterium]
MSSQLLLGRAQFRIRQIDLGSCFVHCGLGRNDPLLSFDDLRPSLGEFSRPQRGNWLTGPNTITRFDMESNNLPSNWRSNHRPAMGGSRHCPRDSQFFLKLSLLGKLGFYACDLYGLGCQDYIFRMSRFTIGFAGFAIRMLGPFVAMLVR